MDKNKWMAIGAIASGAMAVGSALTQIYYDWKERRAIKEIHKAKEQIIDDQHELFAKMISHNNTLIEKAYKQTEGA